MVDNQYEALAALENIIERAHLVLHDVVDSAYIKANEVLATLADQLPEAAEAGMGVTGDEPASGNAEAEGEAILKAAEGTPMERVITAVVLNNDSLRGHLYRLVTNNPDVWRGKRGK